MPVVDFSSLVESVSSCSAKAWLTRMIAHGLVEAGNVDGAVNIVSAFPDAAWRLNFLSELSLLLTDRGDCENSLRVLRDAKYDDAILEILLDVWNFERVEEILKEFAIDGERVKRAVKSFGDCRLLDWLGFLVEAGRVGEALETARGFEEDHYRLWGLIAVMGALAKVGDERFKEVLDEVSDAADSLSGKDYDGVMAGAAVRLASVGKGELALNMAHNIADGYTLAFTLINCLPYLEENLLENTVNETLDVAAKLSMELRGEVLINLFYTLLDASEKKKTLLERIMGSIPEPTKSLMQVYYAKRLSEHGDETFKEFYYEGMKTLRKTAGKVRSSIAEALVEFAPKEATDDLIKFIKEIPDTKEQNSLLLKLSLLKSSTEETEDALKIARNITTREDKSKALYKLVCVTHNKDFENALNIANEIPDRSWRERAFSYLFASALGKGEFREDLFGKVMAGLASIDEGEAQDILTPMIISLATAGRKELEYVVNQISKLDYLNPLRKALPPLIAGDVENALRVAREESSGFVKPLLLSAIAVKASQARTFSPKKILDEARREVKRLKDEYGKSYALTVISFASAIITGVKSALESLLEENILNFEETLEVLVRLASIRQVDDLIKFIQNFKPELKRLVLLRIITSTYLKGCKSASEKVLDTLIFHEPAFIPLLIGMFESFEDLEFIQKLVEIYENKAQILSFLGSTYAFKGEAEKAKESFQKALEEFSKIPPGDTRRLDNLYILIANMIISADESYLDFAKKFLQEDEFELFSQFLKASNYASKDEIEKVREIFQSIKSRHASNDILRTMTLVAGRMKGENSRVLLKEIFETKETEALHDLISSTFVRFIRIGGDIKTAVEFIEKNWPEDKRILPITAQYFFLTRKRDKFKKIFENMSYHNKVSTIEVIAPLEVAHSPEELAELTKEMPPSTKDKALASIAEEHMRNRRIEDTLNTLSKITSKDNYNQALKNTFLTLLEKLAKE
ncbi:MAG: hypothetical protein KIH10_17225 [Candidatus Freyarchaeota archaeon]|nr:hypothetical protein [Candidatus Jordarchaeia archaeon]MBS7281400.1 hypothetical protein [Candidatus Jordarchaeia archaeon]